MYRREKKIKILSIALLLILFLQISIISINLAYYPSKNNLPDENQAFNKTSRLMDNIIKSEESSVSLLNGNSFVYEENDILSAKEKNNLLPNQSPAIQSPGSVTAKVSDLPKMEGNTVISNMTITNDADLLSKANTNSWKGVGTKFDPIIIENYNFTGGTPSVRLSITDVKLYFVVLNCMFGNAANLTHFLNASNAIIKGNFFSSASGFGLYLDYGDFV